ncbi:DNA repair protein XRCC3 isoform X1 [Onthophagus taurus]|uniref:DNA repair protein XRCC3 isoform X1 n=1 Tax=Onthophagus taurus TaxID=166361 RepID=UPI0039BE4106
MDLLKSKVPDIILNKLNKLEISSLESLLTTKQTDLEQKGLNFLEIEELREAVSEILVSNRFHAVLEIPRWSKIRVGCKVINDLLKGGIPINGINEIYGPSGVGKTQFCLELAIMTQFPLEIGGYNKNVLYICTEEPFPSKRLNELVSFYPKKILDKPFKKLLSDGIYVEYIADFDQLRTTLTTKMHKLLSFTQIGLIIIDSIAGIFRNYCEDINYISRKNDFKELVQIFNELTQKHKIAVLCTNQVSDDLKTGKTIPALGLAWSNYITSRFLMTRYGMSTVRNFEVIYSPELAPKSCNFQIYQSGIGSVDIT